MTPKTYGKCRQCQRRNAGRPDGLCHVCRRTMSDAHRDASREYQRRKKAEREAAGPQFFTPPPS